MPDFLTALAHFRAGAKPLTERDTRFAQAAEFDLAEYGANVGIETRSPPCAGHAVPVAKGRRTVIAEMLGDAMLQINGAASK